MKKEYTTPVIEILVLNEEDIVTGSGELTSGTDFGYGEDSSFLG